MGIDFLAQTVLLSAVVLPVLTAALWKAVNNKVVAVNMVLFSFQLFLSAEHCTQWGHIYDEFQATEIKYCCMACARDSCCIAYSYDKLRNRCFMKAAISDSYKTSTMTSGLKANSHAGQGSMLKNIRIYGGTASAVKLPNSDDCLQFCTAYGIFSWSPPRENSDETDGECSCMSRISSIEYSFGSKSAIFPPVSNLN